MNARSTLLILFAISCLLPAHAQEKRAYRAGAVVKSRELQKIATPLIRSQWVLIFEDNFDGQTLDTSRWYTCSGGWKRTHGVNEPQYYKEENIVIDNGIAKLVAKREPGEYDAWVFDANGQGHLEPRHLDYTSGWIETKGKYLYGLFEARIKMPAGTGFWPAFWLYGNGEEIDIFEINSDQPKRHHITIHNWPPKAKHGFYATHWDNASSFSDEYHIFSLEWDPEKVVIRVDGIARRIDYRHPRKVRPNSKYEINPLFPSHPQSVRINLAVAPENSSFAPPPNEKTVFPASMDVDYIRIYQRKK